MPEREQNQLTLNRECRGGFGLSCPSLLDDEVEDRGGGDMPRGGGVAVRTDEIRGEDGPPFGDKGGDCTTGNGLETLDVVPDAVDEIESKALSNFNACEESTPPNASSNVMAADGPSEDLRGGKAGGCPTIVGADPPAERVSNNDNGLDASTGANGGIPLLAGTPKALSNPSSRDGNEGLLLLPLVTVGGGKAVVALLADVKSKLSSNAVSKDRLVAEGVTPLLGIIPIASSKAFTPATLCSGSTGNGSEVLVKGAPKASVKGGSEVMDEPKLSVGTVNEEDRLSAGAGDDGLGVCRFVDSEVEVESPNASSNEVEGTPLATDSLFDVFSADVFNLCCTSDKGSSSLSDSSTSISLIGAPRSVSAS